MYAREGWIECDSLFELINRFRQETSLTIRTTNKHSQLRLIPKLHDHLIVNFPGRGKFAPFQISKPQRIRNVIVIWSLAKGALQFGDRFVKVTQHEVSLPEHVVCAGAVGILVNGPAQRLQSLLVLLQVKIGDGQLKENCV